MSVEAQNYDPAEWPKIMEGLASFMKDPKPSDTVCFKVRALLFDQRTGDEFRPLVESQLDKAMTTWKMEAWATFLDVLGAELQDEDRKKVKDATPKPEQKLNAKDRKNGFLRAWQELLFARSKMNRGKVTQGAPVSGGVTGIMIHPSPEPANNHRPSERPDRKDGKSAQKPEKKKLSKSKRSRHSDTDSEDGSESSEDDEPMPDDQKEKVAAMKLTKAENLQQFLDCFHRRRKEEDATGPFAVALNEMWKVDKRATDMSRRVLSDRMKSIIKDRDVALGLHPFWDELIQTNRSAVAAMQALNEKYGRDLHFKLATASLESNEANVLLEWASFLAAVKICQPVPVNEVSQEVKGWLMEVRVRTYQYMYIFAADNKFAFKWELPVPPNAIASRFPVAQPTAGQATQQVFQQVPQIVQPQIVQPQIVQHAPMNFQQGTQGYQPQPQVVLQPMQLAFPPAQGYKGRPQQRQRAAQSQGNPAQVQTQQFQQFPVRPGQNPPAYNQGFKQGPKPNFYR
jgi:hypothetical protein